jgi:TLD
LEVFNPKILKKDNKKEFELPAMSFKVEDAIDKLELRLGRSKTQEGQSLCALQVTESEKFSVFLGKSRMKQAEFEDPNGLILLFNEFSALVREMQGQEEEEKEKYKEEKDNFDRAFKKMREDIERELGKTQVLMEEKMFQRKPATRLLLRLKDGHLDKDEAFLEAVESFVRGLKVTKEVAVSNGMANLREMEREIERVIEVIRRMGEPEKRSKFAGDRREMIEMKGKESQTQWDEQAMVKEIMSFVDTKLEKKMEKEIDQLKDLKDLKNRVVFKEELMNLYDQQKLGHSIREIQNAFSSFQSLDFEQASFLIKVVRGFASNPKFSLLFQGSRDWFAVKTFHEKCDGKGATLTIARNQHGKTFGGFASKSWSSPLKNEYSKDEHAVLFSLDLKKIFPQRIPNDIAIHFNNEMGPFFANSKKWSFKICDNCDKEPKGGFGIGSGPAYSLEGATNKDVRGCEGFYFLMTDYAVYSVHQQ